MAALRCRIHLLCLSLSGAFSLIMAEQNLMMADVDICLHQSQGIDSKTLSAGELSLTGSAFLTHFLTHNGKCACGSNGAKRPKQQADTRRKGPKRPEKRPADFRSNFRNHEVESSNLSSSSRKALILQKSRLFAVNMVIDIESRPRRGQGASGGLSGSPCGCVFRQLLLHRGCLDGE